MIDARAAFPPRWILISLVVGAYAALVAATPSLASRALLVAPLVLFTLLWWTLAKPHRWVGGFIAAAILLPPLPIPIGDSGPHLSLLFAAFGILSGALYLRYWRITAGPLERALIFLFLILVASAGIAAFFSGAVVAAQTLARVVLFGIGVYLYFFTAYVPSDTEPLVQPLFWAAALSAAIACVDFYYQLPAPAGFGPQYVWLESGTYYRRAQGIFYEASTLGDFCTFFLVMIAVAFTRTRRETFVPRAMLVGGGVLFSAALLFSYSRSSIVNLLVALAALAWMDRRRIHWRTAVPMLAVSVVAGAAASYYFLPRLVETAWMRLSLSVVYFFDAGDAIFSGRIESWRILLRFLSEHPWHAIVGIGYKTLPYSDYIGQTVIGDNMYLSMLIETGVAGLAALVWLNFSILRAARRIARNASPTASFLGTWIFCFWAGQTIQMFSADLLTYWRVLPVYFLVLAWGVRESNRAAVQ